MTTVDSKQIAYSPVSTSTPNAHFICSICWEVDCNHFTVNKALEKVIKGGLFSSNYKEISYVISHNDPKCRKIGYCDIKDDDRDIPGERTFVLCNCNKSIIILKDNDDIKSPDKCRSKYGYILKKSNIPRKYCKECKGTGDITPTKTSYLPCDNCKGLGGVKCTKCVGGIILYADYYDNGKISGDRCTCDKGYTDKCVDCKGACAVIVKTNLELIKCDKCTPY